MAASSSSSPFFGTREGEPTTFPSQENPFSHHQPVSHLPPGSAVEEVVLPSLSSAPQKKRGLPGASSKYPDAEVIALSPKSLIATNRFICEVCKKGFQREQNLQLHRRGHNLPWKLKQKTKKDQVRKKVYLCPEPTCVHHHPARALGDLTGIKKHYFRKHSEKKFKCEKCSKRYAVQSDWKAHSKTCGTREYRCECGTLFSRRDSFITHRAFCDALAHESTRYPAASFTSGAHLFGALGAGGDPNVGLSQMANHQLPTLPDHHSQTGSTATDMHCSRGSQFQHLPDTNPFRPHQQPNNNNYFYFSNSHSGGGELGFSNNNNIHHDQGQAQTQAQADNTGGAVFSNKLFTGGRQINQLSVNIHGSFFPNNQDNDHDNHRITLFGGPPMGSVYSTGLDRLNSPCMSATALLQKAAQIGSTTAGATSLLMDTVPACSSSSPPRTFGGLYGDQNDQNNLHDLINSLTSSNGGPWVGLTRDGQQQQQRKGGSSEEMTRDFLGVGEVVRNVNDGFNSLQTKHPQQQPRISNASNSASRTDSRTFGASANSFQ